VYDELVNTHRGDRRPPGPTSAFLLAQIGAHAAGCFAELMAELGLTPAQAGLLRLVALEPGQSQQAVAAKLGTPPSRLVLLVDALEERGLLERRRNDRDRRHYALHLTPAGTRFLREQIRPAGKTHDDEICAGLTAAERAQLHGLLDKVAARQGLTPGVHPGYRQA
jgi:DNA-binding MarR family transcriptional regulator